MMISSTRSLRCKQTISDITNLVPGFRSLWVAESCAFVNGDAATLQGNMNPVFHTVPAVYGLRT